ncbi:hypothetical protein ACGFZR_14995 [Streptomyces sp. NPDC048241]|uniref:hypothetical protein n=1 Tax=Streptomyces sp. NPDC048241 TaxID=3365521 RepID=UPI0037146E55
MANTTPSSRKPRSAARSASRPTNRAEEPEVTAADAQEIEADGDYITVTLDDEPIRVLSATLWRTSWVQQVNLGDFVGFAANVVHPDDLELFQEIDPTIPDFQQFTQDAQELSGEPVGKSRGPNRSSRRTQRR